MSNNTKTDEQEARKIPQRYIEYLKQQTETVSATVESATVEIFHDVFRPATDTSLLGANLKSYIENGLNRVLDVGSGSGVLAVLAGLYGASGAGVDINSVAVSNMEYNFKCSGVPFDAIESDVFDNVPAQKFDLIISTPPYLEGKVSGPLDYAIYGTNHLIDELLKEARRYLKDDGRILISFAKFGLIREFDQKLKAYNWSSKIVDTMTSGDGERQYNLYELRC